MLDFYWVRDDEKLTAKLAAQRHLGGLTFEEFAALDHLWLVLRRNGIRLDYMEDSRVSAADVLTALRIATKLSSNDPVGVEHYTSLRAILRAAKEKDAGVVTAAD